MTIRKIYEYPASVLKQIASPVPHLQDRRLLVLDMFRTLKHHEGVGLAANQIGILERIIVISTDNLNIAIINPKITKRSSTRKVSKEGCLSFPFNNVVKHRHQRITVTGYDEDWNPITLSVKGFEACVIQHEVNHLDGITII